MGILLGLLTIIEIIALFNLKGILRFFGADIPAPVEKDRTPLPRHLLTVFIILSPLLAFLAFIIFIAGKHS